MAGQLIHRGKNTWLIRVYTGTVAGKRKYVNRTVRGTKRDAQALLNKLLVERDAGNLVMPSRLELAEYLKEWKEKALKARVTPRTFRGYEYDLDRYVLPALGDKKLSAITALDIQGLYSSVA